MKIRHPLSIGILITSLLVWNRCETTTQRDHLIHPHFKDDTLLISISTQNGWLLDVYSAGDGVLKYRSKARDSFHFNENTFEFDSLKLKLTNRLSKVNFQEPPFLGVRIITSQKPSGLFYALNDKTIAEDLFERAYQGGMLNVIKDRKLNRLKKIYKIHPPFPKK